MAKRCLNAVTAAAREPRSWTASSDASTLLALASATMIRPTGSMPAPRGEEGEKDGGIADQNWSAEAVGIAGGGSHLPRGVRHVHRLAQSFRIYGRPRLSGLAVACAACQDSRGPRERAVDWHQSAHAVGIVRLFRATYHSSRVLGPGDCAAPDGSNGEGY